MNVVILQGTLPHYRVPLFERLGQNAKVTSLEVMHSGPRIAEQHKNFEETVISLSSWGTLRWQHFPNSLWYADVVVAMFDLHWVRSMILPWQRTTVFWGSYGQNRLMDPIRTSLAKKSVALIVYGDKAFERLLENGVPAQKLFVAHNTLDVPNAAFCRNKSPKSLIFVGRLQARKRVGDILYAFAKLSLDLQNSLTVDIVGDGKERPFLESLATMLGIEDRVRFHGTIYDIVQLKELFSNAIAYVSAGSIGLGLLHSFAYGVPVIVNEEVWHGPEIENLRPGSNGMLYSGGVTELTAVIKKLVMEPKLQYSLSEDAFKTYTTRNLENMSTQFLDAIVYAGSKSSVRPFSGS